MSRISHTPEEVEGLRVACPWCEADPDIWCRSKFGVPKSRLHVGRLRAGARATGRRRMLTAFYAAGAEAEERLAGMDREIADALGRFARGERGVHLPARQIWRKMRLGCGDNSCEIRKPAGAGPNGGCRCSEEIESALVQLRRLLVEGTPHAEAGEATDPTQIFEGLCGETDAAFARFVALKQRRDEAFWTLNEEGAFDE